MRKYFSAIAIAGAFVMALRADGPEAGRPGKVWTEEGSITAVVTKINHKTREITLKGSDGDPLEIEAGPDVKNFDQIKKGDTVVAHYTESTAIFVRKPGDAVPTTGAAVAMQTAAEGEKPGATLVGTMEITATVESINYDTREVTLVGPKGNARKVKVGPDVARLNEVKKGDIVVARVTKSVALSVQESK